MTTSADQPLEDILKFTAEVRTVLTRHGVTGSRQYEIAVEIGELAIRYAEGFYYAVRRNDAEITKQHGRGISRETSQTAETQTADRPPFEAGQRDCGGDEASGGMGRGSQETGDIGKIG